jgi:hypothetical protein
MPGVNPSEKPQPQSEIFVREEADKYFRRNVLSRGFSADYVLSLFPKADLATWDIAEWGIGGGQNLLLLANYAQSVAGYDASQEAIDCFRSCYTARPDAEKFYAQQVNLCQPFKSPRKYKLIIFGFFAYYVTDEELGAARANLAAALETGGYVFVYDFLRRRPASAPDSRNPHLKVFKRDLSFWLRYFEGFDLVDFRLFDNEKVFGYKLRDSLSQIDLQLPVDDNEWNFGAVWRSHA